MWTRHRAYWLRPERWRISELQGKTFSEPPASGTLLQSYSFLLPRVVSLWDYRPSIPSTDATVRASTKRFSASDRRLM
jgi:hypothetical protein